VAVYDLVPTAEAQGSVVDTRFAYILQDDEVAQGSTIGAPRCCIIIKPTGAIQKIYCPDAGYDFFGAVAVHYWDRRSKARLHGHHGEFHIHPERQDHIFRLERGVRVHEQVFPFNDRWTDVASIPPPAVYYRVHLRNEGDSPVAFDAYGFCELRGNTSPDVSAEYDPQLEGIVAWNRSAPTFARLFCRVGGNDGWTVTSDRGIVPLQRSPGTLSNDVALEGPDPIAVLRCAVDLAPGEDRWLDFLCVLSAKSKEELASFRKLCPEGAEAVLRTNAYYWEFLRRSVMRTPDQDVNQGVLWAKANMLRVQTFAPTGWCFTNDPTRSNNSVGRDTAWMSFGADYLNPDFARESLEAYFRLQEPSGKIVEYYDVRNEKWSDYGLNVNDNTPLVVIALAHHAMVTGNRGFLEHCYPSAVRAMEYMLSQRNDQGLVWCTATGTSDWGIIGWRNVIQNYRISGASTEVNSECYAALRVLGAMARALGKEDDAAKYQQEAEALGKAVNTHLVNPETDLYYLTIDVDGTRRTDITADLVFPVLFGVAPPERAARIISALSDEAFWTAAGIRTVPRDDLTYGPINGYGLLGGVWVAVTYWYAFAAAKYEPSLMASALATSFRHFATDPRRNNTVPGQFSEWLHGEILVNQGMMLSPWDAPRYLWAAIEGAAGLSTLAREPSIDPALEGQWRWVTVVNLPFRGGTIGWIACRMPDGIHVHTTSTLGSRYHLRRYTEDITERVRTIDAFSAPVAFASDDRTIIFIGNSHTRTLATAASLSGLPKERYSVRLFSTILNDWQNLGTVEASAIEDGIPVVADAHGFAIISLEPAS